MVFFADATIHLAYLVRVPELKLGSCSFSQQFYVTIHVNILPYTSYTHDINVIIRIE